MLQFFDHRSSKLTPVVDERYAGFVRTVVNDPETEIETRQAETFYKFLTDESTHLWWRSGIASHELYACFDQ